MKDICIPGSQMPMPGSGGMFSVFEPLIAASDGLTLSQVCALTGLESSTIQNWVKRGFVARPVEKKYRGRQLARILLINSLRDSMKIETIGELMSMVNGSANDESDDIISEQQLYDYFCEVLRKAGEIMDDDEAADIIAGITHDYKAPVQNAISRLNQALGIMHSAYISIQFKRKAELKLTQLRKEVKNEHEL